MGWRLFMSLLAGLSPSSRLALALAAETEPSPGVRPGGITQDSTPEEVDAFLHRMTEGW
jgi:hypothetical protein